MVQHKRERARAPKRERTRKGLLLRNLLACGFLGTPPILLETEGFTVGSRCRHMVLGSLDSSGYPSSL
jgi:hypothetical protein